MEQTKHIQASINMQDKMQRTLLDNIPDCIAMILKKDTREIVASNKFARESGATPGKTCFRTCAGRDDSCPFCLAPKLWETGQSQRLEVKYRGKWYEGIWVPLSGELYVHYIFDITKRKRTEESLLEREEKYRNLFNNAEVGMFRTRLNGSEILDMNEKFLEIFGRTREEMLGTPSVKYWADPAERQEMARRLEAEGCVTNFECGMFNKLGETRRCLTSLRLYPEQEILEGSIVDITEQKLAEVALRESESKYRAFFEKGQDGIVILDPETTKFIEFNDQACQQLGYSREEFSHLRLSDIEVKETAEEIQKHIQKFTDEGYEDFETIHRTKWGENKHVHVRAQIIETKAGKIYHCIWRDVTERKLAEEALKESENRFRDLVEMLPEAVFETDANLNLTFVNRKVYEITGYTKQDFENGLNGFHMVVSEDRKKVRERILKRTQGEELGTEEYLGLKKDGSTFPILLHAVPIMDRKAVVGFRGIIIDITDRKRMERQINQNLRMESIGALAGGIAHDFNNILSSIIGFTELAFDDVKKGTLLEENLQEVYTAGLRAKDLIKQILAFARQSDEEKKPIRVDTIIEEVLKLIRSTIPTTIEIKQNIENHSLIMGNAVQVNQILMNLCTNAAHAMEDMGGVLEVEMKNVNINNKYNLSATGLKPGDYIVIRVSDTGEGIRPDIIDLIFDPYFTTKGPGEGTGMGLALVNGIVESHGGKITVETELGKGTVFSVYLPTTKQGDIPFRPSDENLPRGTEHILLIDDELPIARMAGQILERLGYSVTIRTSSVEALELFRLKPDAFELVISDTAMPNMPGDKLAANLMEIRSDIPIILCTGYSKKISDDMAKRIGIRAFAYKPLVKSDLANLVRKVLDQARERN